MSGPSQTLLSLLAAGFEARPYWSRTVSRRKGCRSVRRVLTSALAAEISEVSPAEGGISMARAFFCDWDRRPAVLFDDDGKLSALALLAPGADWSAVDADDVFETAKVFRSEEEFRTSFRTRFGDFELPGAPDGKSSSMGAE